MTRATAQQRGYTHRWATYRKKFLKTHTLCVMCLQLGKYTQATVVDHLKPHRGDNKLFWNPTNHQALCKHCHDSHKQRLDKSGSLRGSDTTGVPLDKEHHWNK